VRKSFPTSPGSPLKPAGVRQTWKRLLDSESGIISIKGRSPEFAALPSQVAAVVPEGKKADGMWNAKEWLNPGVGVEAEPDEVED